MATNDTGLVKSLEGRSSTAFLIAGMLFVADAALVGSVIVSAGEELMLLGQAFIAAGWTAGFVGLLGIYPTLAEQRPRMARVGAVLVGIGVVVFVVMGVASIGYFTNVLSGDLSALVPIFLPGVIIGSVLGFLTFGVTTLRSDVYSRTVGVLFVVLGLIPVVNITSGIAGIQSMTATLTIVVGLAIVNVAIGFRLRIEDASTRNVEPESPGEPAA